MKPLPLAEAIREARAELERCQQALMTHQVLKTERTALSILEVQTAAGAPLPDVLPGDDLVVQQAAGVPSLADLRALEHDHATPAQRLLARRHQLDLIEAVLIPLVERNDEVAHRFHHLQHEQHHALEAPEWEEVVEQLRIVGDRRDEIATALAPVHHQIALLEPVIDMLEGFHPQLQDALVQIAFEDDPHGQNAWRTALMARQQLVGLAGVIEQLGLVLQYPFEPMLPDSPHPRHRRRLKKEAAAVLDWMVELSGKLGERSNALIRHRDTLQALHDEAETQLKEWMG